MALSYSLVRGREGGEERGERRERESRWRRERVDGGGSRGSAAAS
jgi:hypothetical protein